MESAKRSDVDDVKLWVDYGARYMHVKAIILSTGLK